jgi:hypothetical protein
MQLPLFFALLVFPAVANAAISIEATVVDADRTPLPGATVTLIRHTSPLGSSLGSVATGYSNGEGRFDVEVREAGVYSVRAELLGGFLSAAVGPFLVALDRIEGDHVLPVQLLLSINSDLRVDPVPHQSPLA